MESDVSIRPAKLRRRIPTWKTISRLLCALYIIICFVFPFIVFDGRCVVHGEVQKCSALDAHLFRSWPFCLVGLFLLWIGLRLLSYVRQNIREKAYLHLFFVFLFGGAALVLPILFVMANISWSFTAVGDRGLSDQELLAQWE
jgi:hypothetical protein